MFIDLRNKIEQEKKKKTKKQKKNTTHPKISALSFFVNVLMVQLVMNIFIKAILYTKRKMKTSATLTKNDQE